MRKLGLSALVFSMAALPFAALSQESAAPSPDDFVCALTGECPEEADEPGETAAQPAGTPRVSATRGFSLSRPTAPTRPATKAAPATRPATRPAGQRQVAQRPAQRPAAQQPGRVDLRLAFGSGSVTLDAADQTRLRAFAEALKRPQLANMRVRIEGHTDSSGGRAINLSLSQRRAQAVADFLVREGVEANRLEVRGFGYERPLPGRPASAGENRRVEAVRIS